MLTKKIPFSFLILIISFLSNCNIVFAQWVYPELNNLKTDMIILYDVIYEKELTAEQKKTSSFIREISVSLNKKGQVFNKPFYGDTKINTHTLIDYKNEKFYSCKIYSSGSKIAISQNFKNPKKQVKLEAKETKTIFGFKCDKAQVLVNGVYKDIYYTKDLGVRMCKNYNVDGFLLEYNGFNKNLGHYKVVAKKVYHKNIDPKLFSLDGYKIYTKEEYNNLKKESTEKYANARLKNIGKTSKKFTARSLKGKKISSKDMKGEITVMNFWFTTCVPCKKEIPSLNKLKEKYSDNNNVNFIAIALDTDYKLAAFLKKYRLDYDIVSEGRWLADKYGISSYPTNIVIDKKGIIQLYEIGYKSDIIERISYQIDKALSN